MKKSLIVFAMLVAALSAHGRPNVIIIYSDDHGYTDLGAYGIDDNVDTPNMDRLALDGAMITNGYSTAPQCRSSRAGLMAGRIQNEFGFSGNHADAGEGEGVVPRTYPAGTDMAGQPLLTIADRMKALGYRTGFSGKWHCGPNDDKNGLYDPRGRGFDEYWVGSMVPGFTNLGRRDPTLPHQRVDTWPEGIQNRVILQGKYAETFIERNRDKPFFLYFPVFGPHLPLIDRDDPYYTNFPKQDYPHYNDAQDDVRRQGLALLKAIDDSVGGVIQKLREHGIEENTLILFAGDNGAPTKLRTGRGTPDVHGWNGSNNVPMRGAKGNLMEGGIRVPMFVYWKGMISAGQVIDEMVTTLDFTATTLAAGGGDLPPEFDGVNILPRLTGKASAIERTKPMFWDFVGSQAVRIGDWKLWRTGSGDRLFNIAKDPSELTNLLYEQPDRAAAMGKTLDAWVATLQPDATTKLNEDRQWSFAIDGAPSGVQPDPRYKVPYDNPVPTPYPLAIITPGQPNGKAKPATAARAPSRKRRVESTVKPSGSVDGWVSGRETVLSQKGGHLVLDISGEKSILQAKQFKPLTGGPFTLNIKVKSNASGKSSLFYNKPSRDTLVSYPMDHDGAFHDYTLEIPAKELSGLRFSPAKAKGTIEFDWIRILNGKGKTIRSWEF